MRLSAFPYVTVRVACSKCSRHGSYRLARLADRYGAEMSLVQLLDHLSADCKLRGKPGWSVYDRCGAYFQDLASGGRPPDEPMVAGRPKLKVVR